MEEVARMEDHLDRLELLHDLAHLQPLLDHFQFIVDLHTGVMMYSSNV